MRPLKQQLFIDALALVPDKKSGVGITLQQTLIHLARLEPVKESWQIYLVVPLGKARHLQEYTKLPNVRTKTIWLPARGVELLMRLRLLPPIDWLLGQGVYVFPNYRNLPLWRSRSITYIYDLSFITHPQTGNLKAQRYLSRYITFWAQRADKIVTISEQVRAELERILGIFYDHIAVVQCGVDSRLLRYEITSKRISEIKQKYAIPYDKYLLYVGNIEPRKNLLALLEAYENLPADVQQVYGLVFVGGDGWRSEAFFERLKAMQSGGLQVMKVDKFVSNKDLPVLYHGAATLLHPAIYEGFGITPLEAMACSTPVAVSDLPAIREVVGEAGHYFDPADSGSITRTIIKILQPDRAVEKKIAIGHDRAQLLSWEASARSLHGVLMAELQKGPHRHPLLRRLRSLYAGLDGQILRLAGEKNLKPYRPVDKPAAELRRQVYDDFLKEQPVFAQRLLLRAYVATRHGSALVLRRLLRKGAKL